MARADLLTSLVEYGIKGDSLRMRKVIEAIITEERGKQHNVLAEKLEKILIHDNASNTSENTRPLLKQSMGSLVHEIVPKLTFQDLILPENVTQICSELVEEYQRMDLLRSHNLEPRNRILLLGPPGNGKTSLAEAIAEALIVPLFQVRYESIIGTYLGETAVRLRNLIEQASTRKCVLFFDEFETLGKERGDVHETGEIKRVVSSLLLQIDSLPSHAVVIGATNHPELLDRAVWRRFQIRMTLPQPSHKRLVEWFTKFNKRIGIKLGYSPDTLAKKLSGSNFAEVEEFGLSVFRQYILQGSQSNIKSIVSKTLKLWSARSVKEKQQGVQ